MNHAKEPDWTRGACCVSNVLEELEVKLILIKMRSLKQHDHHAPWSEGGFLSLSSFLPMNHR